MSTQALSDQTHDALDQTVQFTALRFLLVAVVKRHPEKAAVLEHFHDIMTDLSKHLRERAHPGVAQVDPIFVQSAEGSAELLAQLADGQAQFAEKLQEYAQRLLEDCQ